MKCFYCQEEAQAKIGTSKGNIFKALFGSKCWHKVEIYVCQLHYYAFLKKKGETEWP